MLGTLQSANSRKLNKGGKIPKHEPLWQNETFEQILFSNNHHIKVINDYNFPVVNNDFPTAVSVLVFSFQNK
jgi:hypothetical protein